MQVGDVSARLGLDMDEFSNGLEEAQRQMSDTDKATEQGADNMLGSIAKMGAGVALAMGGAMLAVGGLAAGFSDDLTGALNGLQAATGTADAAMAGMEDSMIAIYNANLGESFEDIGAAMTTVAQQTGLTGEALQAATEDGLTLRDTFGMEVNESIRAVDMMMREFGVTSDEAYNLIAQGAQKGLDKNDSLLDSVNEYSVHFKQLGFDSTEMFNMFANGAEAGVYDVDKLGDAMKEFGIRSMDGSKASAEGFKALGLDAGKMTAAFNTGGDAAKTAFGKTASAILAMEDPVKKNAAGVALFGTMWEDVGVKGMEALLKTKGEISNNVDALGKINEVKYDTFGQAMEGIKRNLQTGILLPLGDEVLPVMNDFANWITANMPAIQNEISYAFEVGGEAIGELGETVVEVKEFFGDHWKVVAPILAGIGAGAVTVGLMTAATKTWTIATNAATLAQKGLTFAMNLSPFGKVTLLIGLLVAAGVALYQNWDTVTEKAGAMCITMENAFRRSVNSIISLINGLIKAINRIPGVSVPLIARVELRTTDKSKAKTLDERHGNAKGTDYWTGGETWVGEEGPEILDLPVGSRITPNHKLSATSTLGSVASGSGSGGSSGGGMTLVFEMDGRQLMRQLLPYMPGELARVGVRL